MKIKTIVLAVFALAVAGTSLKAQGVAVESGYVTVEGGKLYYEVAGKGKTIVLLHDGMVHHVIWDEQFQLLARDHRVIRYDRRGFGKSSDPVAAYSHLEDLNQVFVQLNVDKAIIFGMSAGGGLAIDFTLQNPGKVEGLVLVGAVVGGLGYTAHMANRGGHMPPASERTNMRKVVQYFAMEDPYEIYPENAAARERVMKWMSDYPEKGRGEGIPVKPAPRRALKNLGEINVPTLILVGEFDIPDVHAHAGAIEAGIPGATRKIIPKSGHLIPIEQPELFNLEIGNFLKWY
jgi:pimeloyl-ACP methyl ester carboxylesterase